MNRRKLFAGFSGIAACAIVAPEIAQAAAQLVAGQAGGIDWTLAFADLESDVAPVAMRRIAGACPAQLAGSLYRNGPGKFRRPGGSATHWFDGDGLMRAFRIADGQASLAARFVDTPKRRRDSAASGVITPGFGTPAGAGAEIGSNDDANAANISVLPMGADLWALWEAGSPTILNASDLSTKRTKTFRNDLAHMPFLAHPRAEPNGDIWNLGVQGNKAIVWRIGSDGELKTAELIDLPRSSYVHDFSATNRHLIIILPPLVQDSLTPPFIDGFHWQPTEPTQVLVIDKADLSVRRLYELPAFFAFHFGSGWTETDGTIRFDACASGDPSFALQEGRELIKGKWTPGSSPRLTMVVLSPDGSARMQTTDVTAEFPRSDPRFAGHSRDLTVHATAASSTHPLFQGIATHNWRTGQSDTFDFGPTHLVEEAVFVPRGSSYSELDGWLLSPSVNLAAKATELHVFDAGQVSAGPICTWRATIALPVSLHGAFVAA